MFVPAANGRGVVPTPRALGLQTHLDDALGRLRALLQSEPVFDPATSRRTFTIAMQEQPAAVLVPGLARALLAGAPASRLAVVNPGPDAAAGLESGAVDVLVAAAERANGSLMARALFGNDFRTAQRKRHPRGTEPLTIDAFCALDHLVVSTDGGGFNGLVDLTLAGMGRTRRVALSIQSYGLAPLVIMQTDCLCTLPRHLFGRFAGEIDLFEPPFRLPRPDLVALWHARNQADAGHGWFRDLVYRVARETAGADLQSWSGDAGRDLSGRS